MKIRVLIPLIIFLLLGILLWRGLHLDPHYVPSVLIDKPVPTFHLPDITRANTHFSDSDLKQRVSILNVWASWCHACEYEHPVLLQIAKTSNIPIYGLDYKDDLQAAQHWLQQRGNPYQKVGFDGQGKVAIDFGVYGAPETFLIDQDGIIRYKHIGPLSLTIWQQTFMPLIQQLQSMPPTSNRSKS
ncbi:MAG: DsbE family thiol:disulfide interchange protein [Gammaproteobacteria bacterium]